MPTALDAYSFTTRAGVPVLEFPHFAGSGLDAIVTTRVVGNLGAHLGDDPARVGERRTRAAQILGLEANALVFADQVHGATVTSVARADAGTTVPATDALVTTAAGIGLAIVVADCVPIALFDPHARVLATVHAGWRGTVARITERALQTMVAAGAEPARVLAGIGPALSFARNQVGPEVVAAVRTAYGADADALLAPDPEPGKTRFDLQGANAHVLRRGGVLARNIAIADVDTGPDGPFYSHRAEQPCGRFALVATMTV